MKRVVFVSREEGPFAELELMLTRNKMNVEWCGTGKDLLSLLSNTPNKWIDLAVIEETLPDTTAVSLVREFVPQSPMTNTVVCGTLDKKRFHDTYEGYGVLMQLSPTPGAAESLKLETALKKIGAV